MGDAHTANGIGFQTAAAVVGQSLPSPVPGALTRSLGLEIVGPSVLIAAILLLALYEALMATSGKHPHGVDPLGMAPPLRPSLKA